MLLKKQEINEIVKAIYSSSNICASTYDKTNNNLTIIFNNGGQYLYPNVSETDYFRFELADSQGVVFNSHIKKYDFEKLDKIDPSNILLEINELKAADKKIKINHKTRLMIDKMQALLIYFETTDTVDAAMYDKVKESMSEYESIIASVPTTVIND